MNTSINLKDLERKAYRSTFQDGLLDITLGLFLAGSAIAGLFHESKTPRLAITIIFICLPLMVFFLGKKKITIPRMGIVRFGPERKARNRKMTVIILLAVVASSLLALMAMTNTMPFFLVEFLRGYGSGVSFGLLASSIFVFGAYYHDIPRLYFYGFLFGGSLFLSECYYNGVGIQIHSSIAFAVSGLIMLIIGIGLLSNFIRQYRLPTGESAVERG